MATVAPAGRRQSVEGDAVAAVTGMEIVSYNGFTFPTESHISVVATDVYDQAGRTIVYVKYKITVDSTITPTAPVGTRGNENVLLPRLRLRLAAAGEQLVVRGTGFGDLSVGSRRTGPLTDVAWGPKPEVVTWEPLGVMTAHVVWTCEVHVMDCDPRPALSSSSRRLLAHNFTVSHSIDEQGYTSRTITGYLEIPMTRPNGGGRNLTDNADLYWRDSFTVPPVPVFCRRTQNQSNLSEDKRRVNFSVTDQELPANIMPEGVIECRATHSTATQDRAFIKQNSTLRASYTLRKDMNKAYAMSLFIQLLRARLIAQQAAGIQAFIPMSFTAEDSDLYGRQAANFSFSYMYTVPLLLGGREVNPYQTLAQIPKASGLWSLPPGAGYNPFAGVERRGGAGVPVPFGVDRRQAIESQGSWQAWARSMSSEWSSRGHLGLRQTAKDDMIVDLCDIVAPVTAGAQRFVVPTVAPFALVFPVPVGTSGYLKYAHSLGIATATGEIVVKKLLDALPLVAGALIPGGLGIWAGAKAGEILFGNPQKRVNAEITATLAFDIVSVGTPPKAPVLTGVGGLVAADIVQVSGMGSEREVPTRTDQFAVIAERFGVKFYRHRGFRRYLLRKAPAVAGKYPSNYYLDGALTGPTAGLDEGVNL